MPLSREEAIAFIRREAQRLEALSLPLGPYLALFAWAILIDNSVLELQRRMTASTIPDDWQKRQIRLALDGMEKRLSQISNEVNVLREINA